jgi:glycosyltransferase involved in cell wall biosynthesis
VDWLEVWSREYWREYLGGPAGALGNAVQAACLRVPQLAFCFARLHERRLRSGGVRGEVVVLPGAFVGRPDIATPQPAEDLVVFAGRHIPEKRAPAVVAALARARASAPGLRGAIFGHGPEHAEVLRARAAHGLEDALDVPGFVDAEVVAQAFDRAMCMVLPSSREGYGLVVMEAASHGTPSVVVDGPDNAAVELVEDGVNGVIAPSAAPGDLADAILRVRSGGEELRASTREWFRANAPSRSLERSLEVVLRNYAEPASARR